MCRSLNVYAWVCLWCACAYFEHVPYKTAMVGGIVLLASRTQTLTVRSLPPSFTLTFGISYDATRTVWCWAAGIDFSMHISTTTKIMKFLLCTSRTDPYQCDKNISLIHAIVLVLLISTFCSLFECVSSCSCFCISCVSVAQPIYELWFNVSYRHNKHAKRILLYYY